MGMVVRTNTMSTNAYRQLGMNNTSVSKSLEKLSSGFRINRAGDDASGLAISEKMKAQIAGLEQASANSQDGISLIQTAEGATTEIHNMLNRMVTLATKSANGTIQNEVDRENIQTEVDALKTEITRIAKSTNFNGINLLDGSLGGADPILTGGAKFDDTKATAGVTTMAAITMGTTASNAGNKLIYTVDWADASGMAQQTKLEFTLASGSLTSSSGTVHTSTALTPTAAEVASAIEKELKADETFSKSFTITNTDSALAFTNKSEGADTAKIVSVSTAGSATSLTPTAGTVATTVKGLDEGKKLNLSGVGVAATGGTADDYSKATFTIDGKKFMLAANTFTAADTAKVGGEVNIIKLASTTYAPGNDAATAVTEINRAFGNSGDDAEFSVATVASTLAGIAENDILFDSKSDGLTLQVGDTNADFNHVTVSVDDLTSKGLGINSLDVSSQTAAGSAIDTIKAAINKVSTNRGNLGALQNRLEYTINNLDTTNENMTAANSRIRDTDMAKEMMNYTKMNILTQAAQAMLAQANQQPQQILQLLQ